VCLLVESRQELVLIDSGLGQADAAHRRGVVRAFQSFAKMPHEPQSTALQQVQQLGFSPQEVRHIVVTHLHFDHGGGIPDFPHATVHVHQKEYKAFSQLPRKITDLGYVHRHLAHQPPLQLYSRTDTHWFDFEAIRLPFDPAMFLIPLFGHTRGHCGVAIRLSDGWLFLAGDAAPVEMIAAVPSWLVRTALGAHTPRLRAFQAAHPAVQLITSHMWFSTFDALKTFE
jgi:glyoxylase-like metal-dependent hydrolase (beta-lactamase superfamily II)